MSYTVPQWPLPLGVKSILSLRSEGIGQSPFGHNFALHVGDDKRRVIQHRQQFEAQTAISDWCYLDQQHTTRVVSIDQNNRENTLRRPPVADAATTRLKKLACVVMTADCLPILLCDQQGDQIAAIHAGWRGLLNGIIEKTLHHFALPKERVLAYIGPAICKRCFEVQSDVLSLFEARSKVLFGQPLRESWVSPSAESNRYLIDLTSFAKALLQDLGLEQIYESGLCTVEQNDQYYSFRKEGKTGRFISAIYKE